MAQAAAALECLIGLSELAADAVKTVSRRLAALVDVQRAQDPAAFSLSLIKIKLDRPRRIDPNRH